MSNSHAQSSRRFRKTFLLLDPYDSYGVAIARHCLDRLGIRPVALFTDVSMRAFFRGTFPEIESDFFEERINIGGRDIVDLAQELALRYDIVGVAPYLEYHLERLAPVVDALDLDFNSSAVLARCRDKHALKSHLAASGIAVPQTRQVRSLSDAIAAQKELDRFVLKPNAGYSNQDVGFFDGQTDAATLAKHLERGQSFVAEEFVGGQEFSINGQVDEDGTPHVLSIFTGERTFANGRESVYRHAWQLRKSDTRFSPIAAYAMDIVRHLELVRIPFHLEVRLAEDGTPRLVDVGARLIGNELAFMLGRLHGGRLDAIELACRGYLGLDCAPRALDWAAYDEKTFVRVYGVSTREEVIATLEGVDAVEALPAFVRWVKKPAVGQKTDVTLDLNSLPFAVDLLVDGDEHEGRTIARQVEDAIRWNHPAPTFVEKARAEQTRLVGRLRPRAKMTVDNIAAIVKSRSARTDDDSGASAAASLAASRTHDDDTKQGFKKDLKQGLKRNLWPALSHVVKREREPSLRTWGFDVDGHGRLTYQGVDIATLASTHGSPLYVVLDDKLRQNALAYQSATSGAKVEVGFSYKTNPVPGLCARLHELGIGAECISPYEL